MNDHILRHHLEDFIEKDLNSHFQGEGKHRTTIDITDSNFPRVYILGDGYGIMLHSRDFQDKHICFTILVEDDDYWCIPKDMGGSSYWLNDLILQVTYAKMWCDENAIPDMYPSELEDGIIDSIGIQYGFRFKSKEIEA